jgi:hypothetical protein
VKSTNYEALIVQSTPALCYFILRCSEYSDYHSALDMLHPCSIILVGDQVPHPEETAGKMIMLYALTFVS